MNSFIPQNELGAIAVFFNQIDNFDFEVIDISASYPDATLKRKGLVYRAEFEYKSSNFIQHGHDVRVCDIVICWENDINDPMFPLPVFELVNSEQITEVELDNMLLKPDGNKVDIFYWMNRAKSAESKVKSLEFENSELASKISELDINYGKVDTQERRTALKELFMSGANISTSKLAEEFGVSATLIRRELAELRNGLQMNAHSGD